MFTALAKKVCCKSKHKQHHHAAFVVVGGRIQAIGYNLNETHAEVKALQQLWPSKRKGVKLYSFRWRKNGTLGMAKPCSECEAYLRQWGVKTVYYSTSSGKIEKIKL